jgi:hypothetical protein
MALEQRTGGNFISIFSGKFCQRVDSRAEGAVQRTNKLGKIVFEKYYDSFVGKLVDIKIQDSNYGKQWMFSFVDKKDVYNLQLGYFNSFAINFIKMLPNIDLTKEMRVSPQVKEVDGKNRSSIFVNQDGVAIKHAYTKENPNGLPPMVQIMVKGALTWDSTDQVLFLEKMVMNDIKPKLTGSPVANTEIAGETDFNKMDKPAEAINVEDIPF